MPLDLVRLHLCVNDPCSGSFIGRCRSLTLDDHERLTLDSPWIDRSLKCAIEANYFRLGKSRTWSHHGHGVWVGNWCWDTVDVIPACAADVLNYAIGKGYRLEVATSRLWKKIKAGEPLTLMDVVGS